MAAKCSSLTASGKPCKGKPLPGRPYCLSHDPEMAEARREGSRRGGESRATARRVAKQWTAAGEVLSSDDLPAMLRGAMIAVLQGTLEPSQANAIATLAKASVTITNEIELVERIEALERAGERDEKPSTIWRGK